MKKSLLLACFIFIYLFSFGQSLRLLWTGGGSPRNWNDSTNWLQINAPAGQTPLRRVPTEFDDVVFSRSQSGLSNIHLEFPGFDSLVIGKNIAVGYRCRSMRVSNTNLKITNESYNQGYAMTISIFTTNGGNLLLDSSSSVPYGDINLNGGNTSIKDLEIVNSSFGTVQPHNTSWCNIFLNPNGKARFINSQLITPYFGSTSTGGEVFAEGCEFSVAQFKMGSNSHLTLLNTEVHSSIQYPDLQFHIGRNSIFNSSNANVTSWMYLDFYTSGTVLNGNVTSLNEASGSIFSQQDSAHPLPNIVNGNLVFQGGVGSFGIHGDIKISGNFLNNAVPELIHPDTSNVFVNGQHIFRIGGITNYRNNVFISNCAQYLCRFKFELYGSGNSTIKWPVGIPVDTMIINKSGCGKVLVDNSLYVSGQLHVQSGQLVLNPNDGIPYKMVTAGNVLVNSGAGIFLRRNAAGVSANMAIGGTLVNNNASSDSSCFGISNPYNGTILSYNPNVNTITVPICVNGGTTIVSNVSGNTYRWELNTGNGYTLITNGPNFSGTTTNTLQLVNVPTSWDNYLIRCIVNGSTPSHTFVLDILSVGITPAVNIIASATTICNNANVIFTATPVNGGTQPAYQWQVNGINAGTNSPTFSTSTLANGSIVKVIMTSSSSCASPSSVTSNSITVTVSNQIIPSVSITASSQSICTNASVTFIAATVNGGTSPVYQWKKNGSNVGTNSAIFTTTSLINADVISVVMISNASCASNAPVTSNSITMSVSGSVTPGITIDGLLLVDQGGSTTVTSVVTNGGNNPGYQWQDSTSSHAWQNISNAVSPTLNYSPQFTGDKVRALLTSSAACASPSVAVSNELGFTVARPIASDRVTAFPNPATSFVIVDSLSLIDQWNTITVMSLGGKVYFSQNITGLNRVNIPVQGLLPGMYMLMLYRNVGYPLYKKFIKL